MILCLVLFFCQGVLIANDMYFENNRATLAGSAYCAIFGGALGVTTSITASQLKFIRNSVSLQGCSNSGAYGGGATFSGSFSSLSHSTFTGNTVTILTGDGHSSSRGAALVVQSDTTVLTDTVSCL